MLKEFKELVRIFLMFVVCGLGLGVAIALLIFIAAFAVSLVS